MAEEVQEMSWLGQKWDTVKAWFKRSETIFISRLEVATGVVITTIAAVDWSPLWDWAGTGTNFNWKQGVTIGSILTVKGIFSEIARRRGTRELATGQLIATNTKLLKSPK